MTTESRASAMDARDAACPKARPATLLTGQGQTVAGREVEKLLSIVAKSILLRRSCLSTIAHFRQDQESEVFAGGRAAPVDDEGQIV